MSYFCAVRRGGHWVENLPVILVVEDDHLVQSVEESLTDGGLHAREIDPDFSVVYMSGQYGDDWASKSVPNSIMLAKPFAPAQLVTAVSQLLNT
jgi:hypothetical protein